MKLAAVAQRGSRKDFLDLYVLASEHRPLADLLALYQRKYKTNDIIPALTGLTYFDEAENEPSPVMLREVSWNEMKQSFEHWAKELAEQAR